MLIEMLYNLLEQEAVETILDERLTL